MKLWDGVRRYVDWKQSTGYQFETGKRTLACFSRFCGEIELDQVKSLHISTFLNGRVLTASTWRLRYGTLYRFFQYWSDRGVVPELAMPTPKPAVRQTFVPHIFTAAELRSLLDSITRYPQSRRRIDERTFRAILLFLYATGTSVGEVVLIQISDLEIDEGFIKIRSTRANRSRRIPIGVDLQKLLKGYLGWRCQRAHLSPYLFVTKRDRQVSANGFAKCFRRIRVQAGVCRVDGSTYQPRVDDLRYTFAVHRITKWIEQGADLNRMLPALAAYMGQVGLGSTERYLFLAPERFRKNLDRLSPSRGKGNWHQDKDLMRFLTSL